MWIRYKYIRSEVLTYITWSVHLQLLKSEHRLILAPRITFVNSDRITNVIGRLSTSSAPCGHASGSQLNREACRPGRPSTNEARRHDHLGLSYFSSKEAQVSPIYEDSQPKASQSTPSCDVFVSCNPAATSTCRTTYTSAGVSTTNDHTATNCTTSSYTTSATSDRPATRFADERRRRRAWTTAARNHLAPKSLRRIYHHARDWRALRLLQVQRQISTKRPLSRSRKKPRRLRPLPNQAPFTTRQQTSKDRVLRTLRWTPPPSLCRLLTRQWQPASGRVMEYMEDRILPCQTSIRRDQINPETDQRWVLRLREKNTGQKLQRRADKVQLLRCSTRRRHVADGVPTVTSLSSRSSETILPRYQCLILTWIMDYSCELPAQAD